MSQQWKIKKGNHYSFSNLLQHLRLKFGSSPVTIKFMFDKGCFFPYQNADSLDINKLAGFSFGRHHKNSVRIGWRPERQFATSNRIELFFYLYNDGERIMEKFASVDIWKFYAVTISFSKGRLKFDLTDYQNVKQSTEVEYKLPKFRIGYYLWFYFGGNNTAPNDMAASIKIF